LLAQDLVIQPSEPFQTPQSFRNFQVGYDPLRVETGRADIDTGKIEIGVLELGQVESWNVQGGGVELGKIKVQVHVREHLRHRLHRLQLGRDPLRGPPDRCLILG
jgi:hypothetical protein